MSTVLACLCGPALLASPAGLARGATSHASALPGHNGLIAFARFAPGRGMAIYVVRADGSGQHRIVRHATDPAWSRDGRRLAFSRWTAKRRGGIYIANANGRHIHRVTGRRPVEAGHPSWFANGRRIVFAARGYIYSIRVDGHGLKRLTHRPYLNTGPPLNKRINRRAVDSRPAWSVRGRIAFVHHGNGGREEIWSMRWNGRDKQRLTHFNSRGLFSPDWSPDGRQILFQHTPGLWVMNSNGGDQHVIATRAGTIYPLDRSDPVFSPDGTQIALTVAGFPEVTRRIVVMGADGSGPHAVSQGPGAASDIAPAWQPRPR